MWHIRQDREGNRATDRPRLQFLMKRFILSCSFATFATVLVAGACLIGCAAKKTYPQIGAITRIEVMRGPDQRLKTIEDPATLKAFAAFVDARRSGWGGSNDVSGIPVPSVTADIYDGKTFKGHVGIGDGFLETQRSGDFASRSITPAEEREFLRILGLPASMIRR